MKQIERLMEYFPIQRDTMIACLAKPISAEFAAELRNMDIRLEGMSNPKLKEVIKNYLISTRHHQSYRPTNHDRSHSRYDPDRRSYPSTPVRHDLSLHAATKDPAPRPQTPPPFPIKTPDRRPNLFHNSQPTLHTPTSPLSMEKGLLLVTYVVTKIMDGCNALRRRGGNAVYAAPRLTGPATAGSAIDHHHRHA